MCYNSDIAFFEGGIIMAKKNENRVLVTLTCQECKKVNYRLSKNTKNTTDKLTLNKYCSNCRKVCEFKETKTK